MTHVDTQSLDSECSPDFNSRFLNLLQTTEQGSELMGVMEDFFLQAQEETLAEILLDGIGHFEPSAFHVDDQRIKELLDSIQEYRRDRKRRTSQATKLSNFDQQPMTLERAFSCLFSIKLAQEIADLQKLPDDESRSQKLCEIFDGSDFALPFADVQAYVQSSLNGAIQYFKERLAEMEREEAQLCDRLREKLSAVLQLL